MSFPVRRVAGGFISLLLAATFAPVTTDAAPHGKRFPRCCVWRVTNAKAPFYLVGSIHALSKKDYPLPEPYELALKDSNRFVFEFDPTRHVEFQKKFEAAAKYPRGQDIRSKISPELLAWLRKNMFTVMPEGRDGNGERVENFDSQLRYKPWWIAQHLATPAAYSKTSASHGLDNYFVDHAMKTGKEIAGLESVNEHVAVMGGLSDRDGEFMLQDALDQPNNGAKEFSRMYKAWRKGDTNALWAGDAHLRERAPRIAARFVDDRNAKWISRIEAELRTGKPTAIVAGALHFSGPRSVIVLLQKHGYLIEQL
ncbi:MAG: TraB/GumN family protein [Alphaproteobacteria bacterium]